MDQGVRTFSVSDKNKLFQCEPEVFKCLVKFRLVRFNDAFNTKVI